MFMKLGAFIVVAAFATSAVAQQGCVKELKTPKCEKPSVCLQETCATASYGGSVFKDTILEAHNEKRFDGTPMLIYSSAEIRCLAPSD